jgi:hypothetical protein
MRLTGNAAQWAVWKQKGHAVYRELQWCIWMQLLIDSCQFLYIYIQIFSPKNWHFLVTRGKNFGEAFFDVFWNLELNSEEISSIHSLPVQITDLWALVVHDCKAIQHSWRDLSVTFKSAAHSSDWAIRDGLGLFY